MTGITFWYLVNNEEFWEKGGTAQPYVRVAETLQRRLHMPDLDRQRHIVTFLDRETARIDALVDKKRKLIGLLEEKRTATIVQAVTKGLDPTVPMKDSGVEWIGQIPTMWSVTSVRRLVERITSGSRGWAQYYADEGDLFLRIGNVSHAGIQPYLDDVVFVQAPESAEKGRTAVKLGDLLISITADVGSVVVITDETLLPCFVSQHVALVTPKPTEHSEWMAYTISATSMQAQLDASRYGGTKTQLALDDVVEVYLPRPPPSDQQRIAAFLSQQVEVTDGLIRKLTEQNSLLNEYRQALITAAVTGELDVSSFDGDRQLEEAVS